MTNVKPNSEPLKSTRVVSVQPLGDLEFHEDVLEDVLLLTDSAFETLPVAVLCVTGPEKSGKSFYSNLLMHFMRNPEDPGWLSKLCDSGSEVLTGFQVALDTCSLNHPDKGSPGIDLWPERFQLKNPSSGETLNVWVLDICNDNQETGSESLELFVNLVCSKIVEIMWNTRQDFGSLQWHQRLKELRPPVFGAEGLLCDNHTYLFRNFISREKIEETIKPPMRELAGLKHFVNAYVKESLMPVLTTKGKLQIDDVLHTNLSNFVGCTVGTKGGLEGKQDGTGAMTMKQYQMKRHFKNCVNLVNEFRRHEKERLGLDAELSGSTSDFWERAESRSKEPSPRSGTCERNSRRQQVPRVNPNANGDTNARLEAERNLEKLLRNAETHAVRNTGLLPLMETLSVDFKTQLETRMKQLEEENRALKLEVAELLTKFEARLSKLEIHQNSGELKGKSKRCLPE